MINRLNKIEPVTKITPVLPVAALLDEAHTLNDRSNSFVIGRAYSAKILLPSDAKTALTQTFQVEIDKSIYNVKLDTSRIGTTANITHGQTLLLRYVSSQAADGESKPTFIFETDTLPNADADSPMLSKAGQLINQSLSKINQQSHYSALDIKNNIQQFPSVEVLTTQPENSQIVLDNLKQAISNSGLFYESHLADYVEGKRTLSSLLEEPQNKANVDSTMLLVKQLDILEQNKLQWSGQVWAGQHLDWEIRKENSLHAQPDAHQPNEVEPNQSPIMSILALDLPNLGRVVTTLKIQDGRLSIHIQSVASTTTVLLKNQVATLSGALQKSGQQLDSLIVEQHA